MSNERDSTTERETKNRELARALRPTQAAPVRRPSAGPARGIEPDRGAGVSWWNGQHYGPYNWNPFAPDDAE